MSVVDLPPGLPRDVAERLGEDARDVSGAGAGCVLQGNGLVAKVGAAAAIAREQIALVELRPWMPVGVPEVVDAGEGWLLLREVGVTADPWTGGDALACLEDLASLHRAFSDHAVLGDPRLCDPLGRDLEPSLAPARHLPDLDRLLPGSAALAADPTPLLVPLARAPATLLHGDPWPLNVARPGRGRRVWLDWSNAACGPAALDVATWVDQTPWVLDGAPQAEVQVAAYCAAAGVTDDTEFALAVAAATLLWFLAVDAPRIATEEPDPDVIERILAPRQRAMAALGLAP